jgi:hypothetical protein
MELVGGEDRDKSMAGYGERKRDERRKKIRANK